MASGTINMSNYGTPVGDLNRLLDGRLVWSSIANAANNTSTVTVNFQIRMVNDVGTESDSVWTQEQTAIFMECGFSSSDSALKKVDETLLCNIRYSWRTIKTMTFTVYHKDDGSRTMYIGGSFACQNQFDWWGTTGGRAAITLDKINRSKATITDAPNFWDTDNPTITYSNTMGNNAAALEACIADSTGNTIYVPYRAIGKTDSSYTFNLTTAERNALLAAAGSAATLSVRFYVKTTIGSTNHYSYLTKTMTVNAGGPTITASISDVQANTSAVTGGGNYFIRGNNSMKFSMSAVGQKGATITGYSVICGNKTVNAASGTFTNIENDVVIFSATDSRGKTATKTVQLQAIDYVKLTCNQNVRMILQGESSAQINATITGNFYNGSFGATNNTLQLYVRHSRNDGTMSDWVDLSPLGYTTDGNTYSLSTDMSGFDPSGTYSFQCKAVDGLSTAITAEYPVKFYPVFDWSKDDFNFNVPITIEGNPLADYVIETGTTSMGSNGTWYWSKWKSGRAECYGCRNFGNMAVTTAWGNLFRSETFTQSLPYGLFEDIPEVIDIKFRNSNFGGWIATHESSAPSTDSSGSFILVRPASATLSQARISFHVIGRWKE
jgi:hypothetical protein